MVFPSILDPSAPSARVLSFVAACAIAIVSGTVYLYSSYGNQVTAKLGLSASEAAIIGAGVHYGLFLSGPLFGAIVDNKGPLLGGLCAAGFLATGYGGLSLTYAGFFGSFSFFTAFFFLVCVGMGSQAGYMTAVSTNAHNFHSTRGVAMGVPIALFGLSASVFAQISSRFFQLDTQGFLLFVAQAIGLTILTSLLFLRVFPKDHEAQDSKEVDAMINVIDPEILAGGSGSPVPTVGSSGTLHADSTEIEANERTKLLPSGGLTTYTHAHTPSTATAIGQTGDELKSKAPKIIVKPISGFRLYRSSREAQLLMVSILLLSGPGLMYITNVGSIIRSIYRPDNSIPPTEADLLELQHLQNFHVTLISLCSCLGRFSVGLMSDFGKRGKGTWWGANRTFFMLYAATCVWLGQSFGAGIKTVEDMPKVSLLVGLGYGSVFGVGPAIVSEWFGVESFGSNWGFLSLGPALGGQVANYLFGTLHDRKADMDETPDCFGIGCFHTSFLVGAISSLSAVLMIAYLAYRTKKVLAAHTSLGRPDFSQ